jgi:hypothetical protein
MKFLVDLSGERYLFLILRVGWAWVHLVRRPLFGLLYQPEMLDNECGQSVEWELSGEAEILGKNLPQCHFFTPNLTWPDLGSNLDRRGGKPATNRLSYDTALGIYYYYY